MKNLGFSRKITLAASIIIAFSLIVLASINYITVMNHTQSNLQANLEETSQTASSNIANWLNSKLKAIEAIAEATGEISPSMDRSKLALIKNAGNYEYVYVANESGTMVMDDPNETLPADYDPRIRPWYTKTKQLNSASFTKPYVDATSGSVLISGMAPINKNGNFTGVAAGDLSLDFIAQTLGLVDFSGTGHVYLISDDGTVLVHQNKALNEKNISDLYANDKIVIQPELVEASSDSGTVLVGFFPIKGVPSVNWYLAVEVNKELAFSSMKEIRNLALSLTPLAVIIAVVLLSLLLVQLTKPLRTLQTAMRDIAQGNGDLTKRLTITSSDEIGKLAEHFNTFVANIHDMMKDFKNHSDEMSSISGQMHSISSQSHKEMEAKLRLMHKARQKRPKMLIMKVK